LKEYVLAGVGMLLIILGVSLGAFALLFPFPASIFTLEPVDNMTYGIAWLSDCIAVYQTPGIVSAGEDRDWHDCGSSGYCMFKGFRLYEIPKNLGSMESVLLRGTIDYNNLVDYGSYCAPGDVTVVFRIGFVDYSDAYVVAGSCLDDGHLPYDPNFPTCSKSWWYFPGPVFGTSVAKAIRLIGDPPYIPQAPYLGGDTWYWDIYISGYPGSMSYQKDITDYVRDLFEDGIRMFLLRVEPVGIFWNPGLPYENWCSYSATFNFDLVVNGKFLPVAQFSLEFENNNTVVFHDNSYGIDGQIENWHWDFGDGTYSTERNPVHRYENTGAYDVTLEVTDNNGLKCSVTKVVDLTVLHVDFYWYPKSPYVGDNVLFNDISKSSVGEIVNRIWNFGDGTVISENRVRSVYHTYSRSGQYSVKLTVYDNDGNVGSNTKVIEILAPKKVISWWMLLMSFTFVCVGCILLRDSVRTAKGGIYRWRM
jgi:hypothetical protein